jgi:hypothetical protein
MVLREALHRSSDRPASISATRPDLLVFSQVSRKLRVVIEPAKSEPTMIKSYSDIASIECANLSHQEMDVVATDHEYYHCFYIHPCIVLQSFDHNSVRF